MAVYGCCVSVVNKMDMFFGSGNGSPMATSIVVVVVAAAAAAGVFVVIKFSRY